MIKKKAGPISTRILLSQQVQSYKASCLLVAYPILNKMMLFFNDKYLTGKKENPLLCKYKFMIIESSDKDFINLKCYKFLQILWNLQEQPTA